jgi:hypothetical protein
MSDEAMAKRTTVTLSEETYAVLEKWADRDVRTIANLIEAIVVSHLRGMPLDIPKELQAVENATATTKTK